MQEDQDLQGCGLAEGGVQRQQAVFVCFKERLRKRADERSRNGQIGTAVQDVKREVARAVPGTDCQGRNLENDEGRLLAAVADGVEERGSI